MLKIAFLILIVALSLNPVLAEEATKSIEINAEVIDFHAQAGLIKAYDGFSARFDKYEITAESIEYYTNKNEAYIRENVNFISLEDDLYLEAGEVVLYTEIEKFVATGATLPEGMSIDDMETQDLIEAGALVYLKYTDFKIYAQRIEAYLGQEDLAFYGNVEIQSDELLARADNAKYNEGVLTLLGNAQLHRNGEMIFADEIELYVDEERIIARGNSRVVVKQ